MERMLASLAERVTLTGQGPKLMTGTGRDDVHLLVVITSDRGLAGGFNAQVNREARKRIRALKAEGKTVKILTVGRKGRDNLRRDFAKDVVESFTEVDRPRLGFASAARIADRGLALGSEERRGGEESVR